MGEAALKQNVIWEPQPGPQEDFLASNVFEALIGGAAGGGKSDALLIDALRQAHIETYRAILFRRETTQLSNLIDRSRQIIPKAFPGATHVGGTTGTTIWTFPSGARLTLTHMKEEKDKLKHDGQQYQWIGFDELTHFLHSQYIYLYSRCRTADPRLKCYMRSSAMPWGLGVAWVKARFIDNGPFNIVVDKESGLARVFIPANLDDNPALAGNDPNYENRLKLMGPKLFKALRRGDWSVIEGAVFEDLDYGIHACKPHLPPAGSLIWRALDWGYAKPFSVGWYYINCDKQIVRFKEWYGCKNGQPDVGLRMGSRDVARGILDLERSWGLFDKDGNSTVSHGIAGVDIWSKDDDGGDQYDNMRDEGVVWQRATTDRVQGWMECHNRLRVDEQTRIPGLLITEDCKHFWRTIPMLQPSNAKPEDVDTTMEDHIGDEWRYSLMSQPVLRNMGVHSVELGGSLATSNQSW